MELTKSHKEALLSELEKAQEDAKVQLKCHVSEQKKGDSSMAEWFQISHFLAEQRIELIKKSIINSEIDY